MTNKEEDENYLDRLTLKEGDWKLVKRGTGPPLAKLRIPDDWVDETPANETVTIIGVPRSP
jgi:hypothetical protein